MLSELIDLRKTIATTNEVNKLKESSSLRYKGVEKSGEKCDSLDNAWVTTPSFPTDADTRTHLEQPKMSMEVLGNGGRRLLSPLNRSEERNTMTMEIEQPVDDSHGNQSEPSLKNPFEGSTRLVRLSADGQASDYLFANVTGLSRLQSEFSLHNKKSLGPYSNVSADAAQSQRPQLPQTVEERSNTTQSLNSPPADIQEAGAPSNLAPITSQPTLVPNTRSFERNRGNGSAFGATDGSAADEVPVPHVATVQPHQDSTFAILGRHVPAASERNATQSDFALRTTMGYTNSGQPTARGILNNAAEKMESSSGVEGMDQGRSNHTTGSRERDDDDTTIRSLDSTALDSPAATPLHVIDGNNLAGHGTPSTTSTAPSTDEASSLILDLHAIERLSLRPEHGPDPASYHRRSFSWDNNPLTQYGVATDSDAAFPSQGMPAMGTQPSTHSAWNNSASSLPLVASFRGERDGLPPMGPAPDGRGHPHAATFAAQRMGQMMDNRFRPPPPFNPYQVHPQQRKPAGYQQQSSPTTPPRGVRGQRLPAGPSPHRPASQPQAQPHATGGARSPSEILKTLLRKKACLYEPDTSRAVALATWLVGRTLALETGFFSRQQLQAGVHACVADKIHSGVITRTKVNRCMQIILNSCFHYIIPRPDGTEENGEGFRRIFVNEATDDSHLLRALPHPWNDMVVDRQVVTEAARAEIEDRPVKKMTPNATPQSSPRLEATAPQGSPVSESHDDHDSKRAVLLCFNENVRRAVDVFRCHNEFIRDTAHASHLQLSPQEWRLFFGNEAAGAPNLWGNIGIPVALVEGHGYSQADALGVMTRQELAVFRTSWCAKRYDHEHVLCGFAHTEINSGWLRRDPSIHNYKDEMCPLIRTITNKRVGRHPCIIHECPHGVNCEFAHSPEEIAYHPKRYKSKTCSALGRTGGGCTLGDVCSNLHPADSYRFPKKADGRSPRHGRQNPHSSAAKGPAPFPEGAPILYASPAPESSFERQLHLPGLQQLYRRNCSASRTMVQSDNNYICCYNVFGDDNGTDVDVSVQQKKKSPWELAGL